MEEAAQVLKQAAMEALSVLFREPLLEIVLLAPATTMQAASEFSMEVYRVWEVSKVKEVPVAKEASIVAMLEAQQTANLVLLRMVFRTVFPMANLEMPSLVLWEANPTVGLAAQVLKRLAMAAMVRVVETPPSGPISMEELCQTQAMKLSPPIRVSGAVERVVQGLLGILRDLAAPLQFSLRPAQAVKQALHKQVQVFQQTFLRQVQVVQ